MTRRALTTKHTLYPVRLFGGSLQDDGHESIVPNLAYLEGEVRLWRAVWRLHMETLIDK